MMVPGYMDDMRHLFRLVFVPLGETGAMENAMSTVFSAALQLFVHMVLPLLAVPGAVIVASLVPGGWIATTKNMQPKFSRLSPMTNLGNLFGQCITLAAFSSAVVEIE